MEIGPNNGVFPTYPYPCNLSNPVLSKLASALSPAYFVIAGGATDCLQYVGFEQQEEKEEGQPHRNKYSDNNEDADNDGNNAANRGLPSPALVDPNFPSAYCQKKEYNGTLTPPLWDKILQFTFDAGARLVWHLNSGLGRGTCCDVLRRAAPRCAIHKTTRNILSTSLANL